MVEALLMVRNCTHNLPQRNSRKLTMRASKKRADSPPRLPCRAGTIRVSTCPTGQSPNGVMDTPAGTATTRSDGAAIFASVVPAPTDPGLPVTYGGESPQQPGSASSDNSVLRSRPVRRRISAVFHPVSYRGAKKLSVSMRRAVNSMSSAPLHSYSLSASRTMKPSTNSSALLRQGAGAA